MTMNITKFLKEDVWQLADRDLPGMQAGLLRALKITLLAYQGFLRDLCVLRASALTFYALMSVVPVVAMLFGIAKGFGLEKMLEQQLLEQISHHDTTILRLIDFAQNLLENTKGDVVAGIGVATLLWSVISMIGNIEESFNYIWKIDKERTFTRKLSDYLSFMLLAPVLLIVSSSITIFLKTKVGWFRETLGLPEFTEVLLLGLLNSSPLLLMSALFSLTFIFMPNQKISYKAGIIAGIVIGIIYHLVQWLYLSLQIGVSSYNAIYGSFAALPLFVVWIQITWMIVLFGCEIAFYIQNYQSYRHNYKYSDLSFDLRKIIALQITHLIVTNTARNGKPLTDEQIAAELQVSKVIVHRLLNFLTASGVLLGLKTEDGDEEVYLPAVDIHQLTIAFVIGSMEQCGQNSLPSVKEQPAFVEMLGKARDWLQTSEQNRLLKDV